MNTKLQVEKPDKIEFTLTLTMPLEEWKQVKELTAQQFPASRIRNAIFEMVTQAEAHFYPKEE